MGMMNVQGGTLSQPSIPQATEWMLHPEVFHLVYQRKFATKSKQQLMYVLSVPDPHNSMWTPWPSVGMSTPICLPLSSLERYNSFNSSTATSRWPNNLWIPNVLYLADPNLLLLPHWPTTLDVGAHGLCGQDSDS